MSITKANKMQIINNSDDTPVTIKTFAEIAEDRDNFYLVFIDSIESNTVILELLNQSDKPKYYSRFLILQNSGIPTGRGMMYFYASETAGLTEMNESDLVSSQEYQLDAVDTFEIIQYYPEDYEFIYYTQN